MLSNMPKDAIHNIGELCVLKHSPIYWLHENSKISIYHVCIEKPIIINYDNQSRNCNINFLAITLP